VRQTLLARSQCDGAARLSDGLSDDL
jgi:hypothetical protein